MPNIRLLLPCFIGGLLKKTAAVLWLVTSVGPAASADNVPEDIAEEMQAYLKLLGYYNQDVDGVWGRGSQRAWDRFSAERNLAGGGELTPEAVFALITAVGEAYVLAPSSLPDAVQTGMAEIVARILRQGADPDVRDPDGWTPLMLAALEGHTEIAGLLIEAGADVNARSPAGDTALLIATAMRQAEIMELLLARGADPTVRHKSGARAMDVAGLGLLDADISSYLQQAPRDERALGLEYAALLQGRWAEPDRHPGACVTAGNLWLELKGSKLHWEWSLGGGGTKGTFDVLGYENNMLALRDAKSRDEISIALRSGNEIDLDLGSAGPAKRFLRCP